MADIEAVHALQGMLQAQGLLQLFGRLQVIFERQAALTQAFIQQLDGIFIRQLQQILFHAALWQQQLHPSLCLVCQPGFNKLLFILLRQVRQHYFLGNKGCFVIILLHKGCHDLLRCIAAVGHKEVISADELTLAHEEQLHAQARHILPQAEDIHITAVIGNSLLRLVQTCYSLQLVAQPGSLLKGVIIRCLLHLLLQITLQLRGASVQHHADRFNHLMIIRPADVTGAGRKATLNVVVQAWSVHVHFAAGTQRKHASQQLYRGMHGAGVGIWSVITGTVTQLPARHI